MSEKTVTRAEIIEVLHRQCAVPRAIAGKVLQATLLKLEEALVAGETVKLARFGNFVVRSKTERIGRNPKTGEAARITPRRVVTFRPSQLMRSRVGKPGATAKKASAKRKRAP